MPSKPYGGKKLISKLYVRLGANSRYRRPSSASKDAGIVLFYYMYLLPKVGSIHVMDRICCATCVEYS